MGGCSSSPEVAISVPDLHGCLPDLDAKMVNMPDNLTIIGGGLAGTEAAWQAANREIPVKLYEMRPLKSTAAHESDQLAELVCSNSLGSNLADRASGMLKNEMRRLDSLILACADQTALPAGGALAVDREAFARLVTERISAHPLIENIREEVSEIPAGFVIVASGPLTSGKLSADISTKLGDENLYFYDALAPVVYSESINMQIAFRASRYGRDSQPDGEGDYINCPLDKSAYVHFVSELRTAERIHLKSFEEDIRRGVRAGPDKYFEGCLPIEIIAERGEESLAFGPMRPVGLTYPDTGKRPHAVVQLRQDNLAGSLYNLVGFQTNLKWPEQKRVLRLIPGLENARFARFGMMHRNTFINAPRQLLPTMQARIRADLFFAGQITGVEGYVGNAASGLLAGINAVRSIRDEELLVFPRDTMLGALCWYITNAEASTFQPMKANFGLVPTLPLPPRKKKWPKRERYARYAKRGLSSLDSFIEELSIEDDLVALVSV